MRLIDADAMMEKYNDWYTEDGEPNGVICTVGCLLRKEPTVGGWISVKERMPDRGNTCLVWLRGGGMTFMVFDGSRFVGGSAYSDDRITHWMLLPGAPEEVQG